MSWAPGGVGGCESRASGGRRRSTWPAAGCPPRTGQGRVGAQPGVVPAERHGVGREVGVAPDPAGLGADLPHPRAEHLHGDVLESGAVGQVELGDGHHQRRHVGRGQDLDDGGIRARFHVDDDPRKRAAPSPPSHVTTTIGSGRTRPFSTLIDNNWANAALRTTRASGSPATSPIGDRWSPPSIDRPSATGPTGRPSTTRAERAPMASKMGWTSTGISVVGGQRVAGVKLSRSSSEMRL